MKNKFNSKHNHKNANPNNSKMKGYDFMKKTNKFAAFALAACMMAPMTMATTASFTASAAGTPVTSGSITIESSVANHKYTAYQIFDADLTEESGNITFANVKWGSAIDTTKTAICAAPSILGHKGILKNKKAVCFEGFENQLEGADVSKDSVMADGNIITARGAGVAVQFGLKLVEVLISKERSDTLKAAILCE